GSGFAAGRASALGAAGAGADFFSAGTALAGAAPSPSEIVPTTVFTWTVVPSLTLISCNTPEAGAGISASTLSVEISNNGSSRWILSPGFLSHFVMVPSTMDSPIWGITISVAIIPLSTQCIIRAKSQPVIITKRGEPRFRGRCIGELLTAKNAELSPRSRRKAKRDCSVVRPAFGLLCDLCDLCG